LSQSVAFDPIDVSTTPTWTTQHLQRDSAGRPTTWSLYAGDMAPDALIAKETRLYRKDDRVLAGVRSWQAPSASGPPEPTWGALQIAGYERQEAVDRVAPGGGDGVHGGCQLADLARRRCKRGEPAECRRGPRDCHERHNAWRRMDDV